MALQIDNLLIDKNCNVDFNSFLTQIYSKSLESCIYYTSNQNVYKVWHQKFLDLKKQYDQVKQKLEQLTQDLKNGQQNFGDDGDDHRIYTYRDKSTIPDDLEIRFSFKPHLINDDYDWEGSKRLIYNQLVVITNKTFDVDKTYRATVMSTPSSQEQQKIYKKSKRIQATFKLVLDDYSQISKEIEKLQNEDFYIYESITYFDQYKNTLQAIQDIDIKEFPFQDQIVRLSNNIKQPDYITKNNKNFTFKLNLDEDAQQNGQPQSQEQKQDVTKSQWNLNYNQILNDFQFEAFKNTFQRELSLIQGPPGTGKTYLGSKIVEQLILNKEKWNLCSTPLIIFCQTNHALDQFLRQVLKITQKLVRVGGQSKDPQMEQYNLIEQRKQFSANWHKQQVGLNQCISELNELKNKFSLNITPTLDQIDQCFFLKDKQKFSVLFQKEFQQRLLKFYKQNQENFNNQEFEKIFKYKKLCDDIYYKVWTLDFSFTEQIIERFINLIMVHIEKSLKLKESEKKIKKLIKEFCQEMIELSHKNNEQKQILSSINLENTQGQLQNDKISFNEDISSITIKNYNDTEHFDDFQLEGRQNSQTIQQTKLDISEDEHLKIDKYIKNDTKFKKKLNMVKQKVENGEIWTLKSDEKFTIFELIRNKNLKPNDQQRFENILNNYYFYQKKLKEIKISRDIEIFKNADVVGFTISGGAKYINHLKQLKPQIVVIEEAAEVLLSQTLSVINQSLKHLILIGDHKQLRPIMQCYELSKNQWNISLFERLVENGISSSFLGVQKRMRPEIASYIRLIYGDGYQDDDSVKLYENVKGFSSNVQLFSYQVDEYKKEVQKENTKTLVNKYEAETLASLLLYILEIKQYTMEQITVLSMYSGQVIELKQKIYSILEKQMQKSKENQEYYKNYKERIRITSVDSFQGEEAEIILLSLVRSNEEELRGFLTEENRINVAFSRAKKGLFVIGNLKLLHNPDSSESIWNRIITESQKNNHFYEDCFEFQCQSHKKNYKVEDAKQIENLIDGQVCNIECGQKLSCGHECKQLCHVQPCKEFTCEEIVDENCDKCNETYQRQCGGPKNCPKNKKITLDCRHIKSIRCTENFDQKEYKCYENCLKQLPCGHKCEKKCLEPCTIQCQALKTIELECGHKQKVKCFQPLLSIICENPCDYKCQSCQQNCQGSCGQCFNGKMHIQCTNKQFVQLKCGHYKKVQCGQTDIQCNEDIIYTCNCKNEYNMKCSQFKNCEQNCKFYNQDDGEICRRKCGQNCKFEISENFCEKNLDCGCKCPLMEQEMCLQKYCFDKCKKFDKNDPQLNQISQKLSQGDNYYIQLQCGHVMQLFDLKQSIQEQMDDKEKCYLQCPNEKCEQLIYSGYYFQEQIKKKLQMLTDYNQKLKDQIEKMEDSQEQNNQNQNMLLGLVKILALINIKMKENTSNGLQKNEIQNLIKEVKVIEEIIKNYFLPNEIIFSQEYLDKIETKLSIFIIYLVQVFQKNFFEPGDLEHDVSLITRQVQYEDKEEDDEEEEIIVDKNKLKEINQYIQENEFSPYQEINKILTNPIDKNAMQNIFDAIQIFDNIKTKKVFQNYLLFLEDYIVSVQNYDKNIFQDKNYKSQKRKELLKSIKSFNQQEQQYISTIKEFESKFMNTITEIYQQ
ncbi:P-loop containing nucleoside triphosphate hydrolase [Pseudocohnilembus persalinus]|uniref:p-loop containing nucleoside triphosphate hydrolase n=1 Tax=Pseudocohnilembus persalinus TaxID=266149 RepID=A0A0V0QFM0_PSEPJ|nr:P-loop containing nucleoside triphosphate hydrolase [Pseudocohnilembus persalinus]|eukprot:KRX01010.1 P-loop containing nucleoside triphosphate hydrolase [Pseudocohnilembus persalinus]